MSDPRLEPFTDKKMSWDQRMQLVYKQFPSVKDFNWDKELEENDEVFARIMRDILKLDQVVPGRPGPRPALEYDQGMASLRRLSGQDFTTLCFIDAFEMLGAGKSMTQLARRTGLSRSQVYRLQKGWIEPDVWMLQTVAKAFNKHPSFFVEYRAYFVLANLQGRLLGSPESSIDLYRKLTRDQPVGEVD